MVWIWDLVGAFLRAGHSQPHASWPSFLLFPAWWLLRTEPSTCLLGHSRPGHEPITLWLQCTKDNTVLSHTVPVNATHACRSCCLPWSKHWQLTGFRMVVLLWLIERRYVKQKNNLDTWLILSSSCSGS